jgi:Ran-binding protein 3
VDATPAAQSESPKKSDETHLFSSALTSSKPAEKDIANGENLQGNGDTKQDPAGGDEEKESTEKISIDNNLKLVEAARKYEEMRGAQKRKYEEVECTTGEEDEQNILEINCKLFTFIENNYEERGRGMLRLNDSKSSSHSRVVFRASGSLRVLLNTKVWRDQICEQPSQKSLRLTAFDTNGVIKIYLVMGRNEDISQLYRILSSRIQKAKDRSPEQKEDQSTPDASKNDDEDEEPAQKRAASE